MVAFTKMHGLGNDFVVVDAPGRDVVLHTARIRAIADRRRGVGCDQLVFIDPPRNGAAAVALRFYNADGGESGACGNATRCIAAALMEETGSDRVTIETAAGLLHAEKRPDGLIAVDMGPAHTDWRDIPLADAMDTLALPINEGPLAEPTAVGMGNPHCVFFVADAEAIDLASLGPRIEHHPLFPKRTNVEIAAVTGPDQIRLRVWERGVGITLACGTGACAAAVAANRRGLAGRRTTLDLDGGALFVDWREDGHVVLAGPVAVSFTGEIAP